MEIFTKSTRIKMLIAVVAVLAVSMGGYYGYLTYEHEKIKQSETLASQKRLQGKIAVLEKKIDALNAELWHSQTENTSLNETLTAEQTKNNLFQSQIQAISGTVGNLTKLSHTDKELLQKYSKVYFLNEHYVPENLITIDPQYIFEKKKSLQFHRDAYTHLTTMLESASSTNPIQIISAYRSFGEQSSLKANYLVAYGSGANKFSADQGFSEHQLGTTADLTTPKLGLGFTKFDTTTAYIWMNAHAHEFGFILSYPKNNTYFQYEPWHWRYVGVELATKLHQAGQYFYDLPQREIDSYLLNIF